MSAMIDGGIRRWRNVDVGALALTVLVCLAHTASAQGLPDATTVLADMGFRADEIDQVQAGRFVEGSIQSGDQREIDAALAFLVDTSPSHLVEQFRQGLLDRVDPDTIAFAEIEGEPSLTSFEKFALRPEEAKHTRAYAAAKPGEDLNLSSEEIAAFDALGPSPKPAEVEATLKRALLARLEAYRTQGLAGIAPYARSDGKTRSAGDDLRSATEAAKHLATLVPNAHRALLAYPSARPEGLEETYEWSHYYAHGDPTFALTHTIFIPEGDAWVVTQRQFYVSGGYNCEQAILSMVPMQQGTLVVYTNRTSTDQVTGFGGSAKRKIGSRLLASQLEKLYEKIQAAR